MDAQDGRREAFEALVVRWQKRLWWHAYNLTGRTEAAWDITQESWLAIVRGLGHLNDPARFGGWAYRIVSNKAHDWLCRNGRSPSLAANPEDLPEVAVEPQSCAMTEDVHEILRRLPLHSRVVLDLYYLEGFGLAEIAQILETPEGTVKSRLHAARAQFRKRWELLGGTSPAPVLTS